MPLRVYDRRLLRETLVEVLRSANEALTFNEIAERLAERLPAPPSRYNLRCVLASLVAECIVERIPLYERAKMGFRLKR